MANQQWWESLSIGDAAILKDEYDTTIVRLQRRTATQMIFHAKGGRIWRFYRRTGDEVAASRWHFTRLVPYTNEMHAEIVLGKYRQRLATWCHCASLATFADLDREQCEDLWNVLITLGLVRTDTPEQEGASA